MILIEMKPQVYKKPDAFEIQLALQIKVIRQTLSRI